MLKNILKTGRWALMAAAALTITNGAVAQEEGTIEVQVGQAVKRSYDDLKAAGYAYGPKQEAEGDKTHIWLPYGTKGVYHGLKAVKITDPEPGSVPLFMPGVDGYTPVRLGYKLHFDKPISGFSIYASLAELGLKNAVAGLEYSTDGQQWKKVKEVEQDGIINEFLSSNNDKVDGLKTQDLYLRFYSRPKDNPEGDRGDSVWFKLWMGGDPSWGDASHTFFARQIQLWVTEAK